MGFSWDQPSRQTWTASPLKENVFILCITYSVIHLYHYWYLNTTLLWTQIFELFCNIALSSCMLCTCFSLLLKCGALLQLQEPNTNPCHSKGDQWKCVWGGGGWAEKKRDVRNSRADKWIDRDGWMEPGMKPIQKQTEDKKDLWWVSYNENTSSSVTSPSFLPPKPTAQQSWANEHD